MNMMFAKIIKSKTDGRKMTAIVYDKDRTPIKTVYFGATGYLDYTTVPNGEYRRNIYIYISIKKH